jgi:hypothetical protein
MQMKKIITEGCSTQEAGASRRGTSSSSSSNLGASASEAPKAAPKATRKTAPKASPKTAPKASPKTSPTTSPKKRKKKGGVARIADRIKKLKDKPEEDIWEHDVARLWNDRYMRAGSSKKRKRRNEEKKKHLETFEEI